LTTADRFRAFLATYRSAISASAYSGLLRLAGGALTFGLGVVLARSLGPVGFGVYGLITTVVTLAVTVSVMGTPQLAVRELSQRSARGDWGGVKAIVFEFNLVTIISALALGAVAIVAVLILGEPGEPATLYAAQGTLLTIGLALTALIGAELRGLGALLKGQAIEVFARPAVAFLATLLFVLLGWRLTVASALWIQVAVAGAAMALSIEWIWQSIPKTSRSIPRTRGIPWLRVAIPLALVDNVRQLDGAYGVILVGWLASGTELGMYRVAVACGLIIGMPITIAHVLFGPTAARLFNLGEREELQTLLGTISAALVAMILPVTVGLWFFGRAALILVFGAPYADAWLPLFLISCGYSAAALFGLGPTLLAMCDSERHLMKICIVSVGAGILSAVPLITLYGAAGAAVAMIVSTSLLAGWSRRFSRHSLNLDPSIFSLVRF